MGSTDVLSRRQQRLDLVLDLGNLKLDSKSFQVWVNGESVKLTRIEFELLRYFLEHPNVVPVHDVASVRSQISHPSTVTRPFENERRDERHHFRVVESDPSGSAITRNHGGQTDHESFLLVRREAHHETLRHQRTYFSRVLRMVRCGLGASMRTWRCRPGGARPPDRTRPAWTPWRRHWHAEVAVAWRTPPRH